MTTDALSLWRFPLDQVALASAEALSACGPRCLIARAENFSLMTIFNYDYYLGQTSATPSTALTAMFAAMSPNPYGAVGGLAFIQQRTLSADLLASAAGFTVPDQCNIIGSGGGGSGGTAFYHFTINYSGGSLFLNCAGDYTAGGKYFRSLAFLGAHAVAGDTCIYAGTANCRAVNCTFTNIPTVFNAQGDGCALEQCTVSYDGVKDVTAVIIAGAQCAVLGPGEMFQKAQGPDVGGPSGCTAISIEGAQDAVIANIHLSDWNIAVDFSQAAGASGTQIQSCEIESWMYALKIGLPPGSVSVVTSAVKVAGCLLAKQQNSTDPHPVVLIDPQLSTGNTNSDLSDITLLDCTVINTAPSSTSATQHGLEIAGGTNIKVIGGTYSNSSSAGGAGIAITAACGDVQIIGVNFEPIYPWASNPNSQTYGAAHQRESRRNHLRCGLQLRRLHRRRSAASASGKGYGNPARRASDLR